MSKTILYGKIGRSVPLTIDDCSSLGGDIEFVSTLKILAERHPEDLFVIISRNSGEEPSEIGLPENVVNPWAHITDVVKERIKREGLRYANLSVPDQLKLADIVDSYTNVYFDDADAVIMWAGQHGTTSTPLPGIKDRSVLTKPQDSSALYAGFLLRGINRWRDVSPLNREEVWLNADTRNYLKMRDLKWPLRRAVLAQFNYTTNIKHERGGDTSLFNEFYVPDEVDVPDGGHIGDVWKSQVRNVYSRLEINSMLPGTPLGDRLNFKARWSQRSAFGIIVNETRVAGVTEAKGRKVALRDWVLPLNPAFIYGHWSKESMAELGVYPTPIDYDEYIPTLQSVQCTLTTPASGSGWATAKPWEAFAAGTVCFFHPGYDTQNNILNDAPDALRNYLRVATPKELAEKVWECNNSPDIWAGVVDMQRKHFEKAIEEMQFVKMIEGRIYG